MAPLTIDWLLDICERMASTLTRKGKVTLVATPLTSVTVSVTLNSPGTWGSPNIWPDVGFVLDGMLAAPVRIAMPAGRPDAIHVKGAVPPLMTEKVAE